MPDPTLATPTPAAPATPTPAAPAAPTPAAPAAPTPAAPAAPTPAAPAAPTPAAPAEPTPNPTGTPAEPAAAQSERVVPEADGYTLPEGIPRELGQFAHDHGFTQEQLDATLKQFQQFQTASSNAEKQALYKLGQAHVQSWGEQGKEKLALAKRALQLNDPNKTLTTLLNKTGFANHPAVLDFLANLGNSLREGGFIRSAIHTPPGKKTAAQAMYGDNHPSTN